MHPAIADLTNTAKMRSEVAHLIQTNMGPARAEHVAKCRSFCRAWDRYTAESAAFFADWSSADAQHHSLRQRAEDLAFFLADLQRLFGGATIEQMVVARASAVYPEPHRS